MPAWLTGLLSGVNQASDVNRAERLRKEEQQEKFERDLLTKIADDPQYTTEVRTRAATGLIDIAQGTRKRPRGGFLSRLTGVDPIEAHPVVSEIFRFMSSPEEKGGGLPTGLRQTAPPPPQPGSAAMPTTPAGQPGGGPQSPGQLPSPSGPPSPELPTGPLAGVNEATGAGPQGPPSAGIQVPRQIMRTPQEMAIEASRARYYGEYQGKIDALVHNGVPLEDARAAVLSEIMRTRAGSAGSVQALRGTMPDGTLAYGILDKRPGSPTMGRFLGEDGEPLIGFRPATTSASTDLGDDRESAARQLGYPSADAASQAGAMAQVNQLAIDLAAQRAGDLTTARGQAAATIPLSTNQQREELGRLQNDWRKVDATTRIMREKTDVMQTALANWKTSPGGASEAFRTAYVAMFDPNAVVREGDYVRLGLGQSLSSRVEGYIQSLMSGGGTIPYEDMVGMMQVAQAVHDRAASWTRNEAARIDATARLYNIDPKLIRGTLPAVGAPPPAPAAPPAAPAPAPAPGMAGAPPPAPGATPRATLPPMAPMSSREGTPGQGGPPNIPAEVPPGAPQQGQPVGNRYTGEVRFDYQSQTWVGRLPDGTFVPLMKTPDGRFLY